MLIYWRVTPAKLRNSSRTGSAAVPSSFGFDTRTRSCERKARIPFRHLRPPPPWRQRFNKNRWCWWKNKNMCHDGFDDDDDDDDDDDGLPYRFAGQSHPLNMPFSKPGNHDIQSLYTLYIHSTSLYSQCMFWIFIYLNQFLIIFNPSFLHDVFFYVSCFCCFRFLARTLSETRLPARDPAKLLGHAGTKWIQMGCWL